MASWQGICNIFRPTNMLLMLHFHDLHENNQFLLSVTDNIYRIFKSNIVANKKMWVVFCVSYTIKKCLVVIVLLGLQCKILLNYAYKFKYLRGSLNKKPRKCEKVTYWKNYFLCGEVTERLKYVQHSHTTTVAVGLTPPIYYQGQIICWCSLDNWYELVTRHHIYGACINRHNFL